MYQLEKIEEYLLKLGFEKKPYEEGMILDCIKDCGEYHWHIYVNTTDLSLIHFVLQTKNLVDSARKEETITISIAQNLSDIYTEADFDIKYILKILLRDYQVRCFEIMFGFKYYL